MLNSEREYVDLLFRASKKYASWDPESRRLGQNDTGKTDSDVLAQKRHILEGGQHYLDGKAKEHKIPEPIEYDGGESTEGETWVVSENAEQVDVSSSVGGITPAIAQCKVKGAFRFSSGRGALLVMENTTLTCIDPPGALRRLLKDTSMRGSVIVSEVHCCSSYARMLTTREGTTVALGLRVEPPVSGVASASANATWVRNLSSGNFRSQVNKDGKRKFYPLFRLVSLTEKATSTGLRGKSSEEDAMAPLPDAEPPWDANLKIVQKPAKAKE
ncbi:hypothetical protein B0H12DRAFT_1241075 [Mycena haematopus]|nr:hypothetical protein B0H12DRAFT_1241075 [Mycena haematopus]